MVETVFVYLLNEGTDAWAPVKAQKEGEDLYRLLSGPARDCDPQFGPGTLVRCCLRRFSDGEFLAAMEAVY